MPQLFPNGFKGLSDSLHSGVVGSVAKSVGIDSRSKPGIIKVQQKLTKNSGSTVTELCKARVPCSDGSTLWFSSESGKIWREVSGVWTLVYTLAITALDLITAVYDGLFYSTLAKTGSPIISLNEEGTRMLVMGYLSTLVHEYTLGTAHDISTATFVRTFDATSEVTTGQAFGVSSDGLTMYILDDDTDTIYQYTLSAAWNLSGASYASKSFNISSEVSANGSGISFKTDGTKMYVSKDTSGGIIYQYTLGTPFDISTASYDSVSFSFSIPTGNVRGHSFSSGGDRLLLCSSTSSRILQYSLGTAWDISTLVYDDKFIYSSSGAASNSPLSIYLNTTEKKFYVGFLNTGLVRQFTLGAGTEGVIALDAVEYRDLSPNSSEDEEQYIFWATQYYLFRIPVANLGDDWTDAGLVSPVGRFENGDDTYHPMEVANTILFIGDGKVIASVESNLFTSETNFNVEEPEKITALKSYDTDLLVGTKFDNQNKARVLRWDTSSLSWFAEDQLEETKINAFIRDDNYVYISAGDYGQLYFYNGEKAEKYKRIPGEWISGKTATVYPNAVGYLMGIPVFGLSNTAGNPALQGVYGLGSFSRDYSKTLSLDFPISSGDFTGVTIGAILVKGFDLYVAWKVGSSTGVDKIDWSNKYASAYFETTVLSPQDLRGVYKTLARFIANYASLPSNTGITLSYKKNYEASWNTLTSVNDVLLSQIRANKSVSQISNLQLRVDFVVSSNDSPEVENFDYDFVGKKRTT